MTGARKETQMAALRAAHQAIEVVMRLLMEDEAQHQEPEGKRMPPVMGGSRTEPEQPQ